jgi:hypothetical protein
VSRRKRTFRPAKGIRCQAKEAQHDTTRTLRRTAVGALLSGAVAMAGFGLASGTAQADNQGPYRWCPGQSMSAPAGPGLTVVWDMNVCHTWYRVDYGRAMLPTTMAVHQLVQISGTETILRPRGLRLASPRPVRVVSHFPSADAQFAAVGPGPGSPDNPHHVKRFGDATSKPQDQFVGTQSRRPYPRSCARRIIVDVTTRTAEPTRHHASPRR